MDCPQALTWCRTDHESASNPTLHFSPTILSNLKDEDADPVHPGLMFFLRRSDPGTEEYPAGDHLVASAGGLMIDLVVDEQHALAEELHRLGLGLLNLANKVGTSDLKARTGCQAD